MTKHKTHSLLGIRDVARAAATTAAIMAAMAALSPTMLMAQSIDKAGYVTYTNQNMPNIATGTSAWVTTPPSGYQHSVDPGVSVTYSLFNSPADPQLFVTIANNTGGIANYSLLSNSSYNVATGDVMRAKMDLAVDDAGSVAFINSGFFLNAGVNYNGQFDSETSIADGGRDFITFQSLNAEVVGGSKSWDLGTGGNTTNVRPALVVYNIPAGKTIQLKIKNWAVYSGVTTGLAGTGGNGILPLQTTAAEASNPTKVKGTNTVKVTVPLIGKSFSGNYNSELLIKNGLGFIIRTYTHSSAHWSATQGRITDTFTVDLSGQPLGVGDYTLAYRLIPNGQSDGMRLNMASSQSNLAERGAPNYNYNIGKLVVTDKGGSHVGMAVHYQPATVTPATYKFYRSLADHDLWQPWWQADGSGNFVTPPAVGGPSVGTRWAELDSWAARFAPNPGDRKLLLTFFGTPTNIASDPTVVSPLWGGPPGMISPPLSAKLNTFKDAVRATLNRSTIQGRVFAVECWNEPNLPGMYKGTRTQLADTCQALYEAVQDVNATLPSGQKIPVICPQADSPYSIGYVYGAKTSGNQPIGNYCDWVGAHLYRGLSTDTWGKPYAAQSLAQGLKLIKERGQQYGLQGKEIAVTEFGVHRCMTKPSMAYSTLTTLDDLLDSQKAHALTSALLTMQEEDVHAVALYSHDHNADDYTCRRGGSYVWTKTGGEPGQPAQTDNITVQNALGAAILVMGSTAAPAP